VPERPRDVEDTDGAPDAVESDPDFPVLEGRRAYLERVLGRAEGSRAADAPGSPLTVDGITASLRRQRAVTDQWTELARLRRAFGDHGDRAAREAAGEADEAARMSLTEESVLMEEQGEEAARSSREHPLADPGFVEASVTTLGRRALDILDREGPGHEEAAGGYLRDQGQLVREAIGLRLARPGDLASVGTSIESFTGLLWDTRLEIAALRHDQGHFEEADAELRTLRGPELLPNAPPLSIGCGGGVSR